MRRQTDGLVAALGLIASSAAMYWLVLRAQPEDRREALVAKSPARGRTDLRYFKSSEKVLVMRAGAGRR